ncbi:hypothetical protein PYW08_005583 [Mythimna loreyi]|uniref:Uncharacterized protein n=1 Tax=Mythimna loreyi TaxID=667449 RepID=A0ACC2QJI9_9NEOP|nr:hypothetical protein PYW08_005583 [Mythimna loreyi]
MVGLFMVIVVLRRLRAGAPQPPDGVAGRHQPRESVTSHTRERYARIVTPRSTSPARTPTVPTQCSPCDQEHGNRESDRTKQNQQVTGREEEDTISTTSERRL